MSEREALESWVIFYYEVSIQFTRCPIWNVLGWFRCVQVTSHLKCIRFVSMRSSLPYINMGICE